MKGVGARGWAAAGRGGGLEMEGGERASGGEGGRGWGGWEEGVDGEVGDEEAWFGCRGA